MLPPRPGRREHYGAEAPLPRSSPRYPAELSQFPEGLLHEAFRKLFRSHAAGGSVRRGELKPTNDSWRLGRDVRPGERQWRYLYRAVDSSGATLDFLLSAKQD